MSTIAPASPAQQSSFQIVPKADQTGTPATAAASPAATSQAVSQATAGKGYESAKTRNTDGTFGPKHTVRPPASSAPAATPAATPAIASAPANGLNLKV